mmetsp:Transcript_3511/g.6651  ORF Transcript_3511/g.6651 Transcript_3511/m.6651 type:complete len:89 (-) Transcript_3511:305-571(-)
MSMRAVLALLLLAVVHCAGRLEALLSEEDAVLLQESKDHDMGSVTISYFVFSLLCVFACLVGAIGTGLICLFCRHKGPGKYKYDKVRQ